MSKILAALAFLSLFVFGSVGQSDRAMTCRHSGLFENEFLYLDEGVALCRSVRYYDAEIPQILYTLCKASWLNEPELSGETGDVVESTLVVSVRSFAWFPDKHILIGKGTDPVGGAKEGGPAFFLVHTDTLKSSFFETEADLRLAVSQGGITEYTLIGSEYLFRNLAHMAQKQRVNLK